MLFLKEFLFLIFKCNDNVSTGQRLVFNAGNTEAVKIDVAGI